jgi:hypothetical protein
VVGEPRCRNAGESCYSYTRTTTVNLVERRKHYWNSRWGRLARMDVLVYEDAGTWMIEAREGGSDGKSRWFELPNEDVALDCVRDLISASGFDGWREL